MPQNIGAWLGEQISSDFDLAKVVRRGLPLTASNSLLENGLTSEEFHKIVIPARTFKHRKARTEAFSLEESDKALRAARVLALAERTFGDRERALSWMRQAKKRFEGQTSMQMLQTEVGARLVEEMLVQIDEGMFA